MRIIDRYILRLMVLPLLNGIGLFVVILMSETSLKLAEAIGSSQVPATIILQYLVYSLPRAISWSLPVGVLFGVAMTCTQLARTGELVAMRVGGASLQRIWMPFFFIGLFGMLSSFAIEEFVVPESNLRANEAFKEMTNRQPVLRSRHQQAFRDKAGHIIYVGQMDDRNNLMRDVMILNEDAKGRLTALATAHWAEVRGEIWLLHQGMLYFLDESGAPRETQSFDVRSINLGTALQDYYLDQRSPFEMSARELRESVETLRIAGLDTQAMEVRVQFKYSIPVACLVFVLIAAPLAVSYAHLGSFAGILLSIIIVFLYNGIRSWGLAFGLVGDLPPVIAAWAQNIIIGSIGLVMFMQKGRR